MLEIINAKQELIPFFTKCLLENDVGVIIDSTMPVDSYIAIDIDKYYHKHVTPTPEIADILIVAQKLSQKEKYHIYIVEMKKAKRLKSIRVKNIRGKFETAIEDFMKKRYEDIFMDDSHHIKIFRLFFVADVNKMKEKYTPEQIKSFLGNTKIKTFWSMQPFEYRGFKAIIEYEPPNPLLSWN